MTIKAIRLGNCGPYAGDHEISLTVADGAGQLPVTLIGGMNGSGKTTLLEAVLVCLYGKRSPVASRSRLSYSSYLQSLISRHVDPHIGSYVQLELVVDGGSLRRELSVHRSWRLANKRVTDKLEVWRDGAPDPFLAETWDSFAERLIPVPLATLFFFDGERISDLAESDDTPMAVQHAIKFMLGLDVVDRLIRDLGLVIGRTTSSMEPSDLRTQIQRLQEEIASLEAKCQRAAQEAAAAETRLERSTEELREQEADYLRGGGTVHKTLSSLLSRKEGVLEQLSEARAALIADCAGPLPLLMLGPYLSKIHRASIAENESNRALAALPLLRQRNEEIIQLIDSIPIIGDVATQVQEALASQIRELETLCDEQRLYCLSPLGLGQLESLISDMGAELVKHALSNAKRFDDLQLDAQRLDRRLQIDIDEEEVKGSLSGIKRLAKEIADLSNARDAHLKEQALAFYRLGQTEKQLGQLMSQLQQEKESHRIVSYALKSQSALRELKKELAKHKVLKLSRSITEAFGQLTQKASLFQRIDIDPASLKISLYDREGHEIPKHRLSSGERQMLAVAILWGLAHASGRPLPVIVDTPLGRLDSSHRMNFVTQYLPRASHQVIVLSTDTEINGGYLEALSASIGRYYFLDHDPRDGTTAVRNGYFHHVRSDGSAGQAGTSVSTGKGPTRASEGEDGYTKLERAL